MYRFYVNNKNFRRGVGVLLGDSGFLPLSYFQSRHNPSFSRPCVFRIVHLVVQSREINFESFGRDRERMCVWDVGDWDGRIPVNIRSGYLSLRFSEHGWGPGRPVTPSTGECWVRRHLVYRAAGGSVPDSLRRRRRSLPKRE